MAVDLLGSWATDLSHDTAAGSNRMMVFFIHTEHSSAISIPQAEFVQYGGVQMSPVPVPSTHTGFISSADTDDSFVATTEAWYLLEAGVTDVATTDFFVDWLDNPIPLSPDLVAYGHTLLQGVDQGTPFGQGAVSFVSTQVATITTDALASNNNDMVMWGVTSGNDGPYTPNNSFTEGSDQTTTSHTGATAYKVSTGAAETPSATYDDGNPNRQTMLAFTVQQQVAVRPQDSFTFADNLAAHNTHTLIIGDTANPETDVDDLDRGVTVDEGGGNVTQQRSQNDVFGPFVDNIARGFTFQIDIQEALTFLDSLVRNVHNVAALPDTFTLLENLSAIVTEGDGWVRVGTPVGTWAAAPAPDTGSRPQTLGTFTDVSGGIDFIPVLASGAKGGPYWRVATDRPTTLRSKSNITSDPALRP